MHVNTNDVVISQSNSIAYDKSFTKILRIFHIIAIWGLVFGADGADHADESKRTKRLQ